jgi:large subunit ribosomal protein L25
MPTQQKDLEILIEPRLTGKIHCRKYRRQQKIPGVVYGSGKQNFNFVAEEKIIKKFSSQQFENAIFTLKSEDAKIDGTKVLLKEVTVQPVTRRPVHIDLFAIDMNKEVKVAVELKFVGKAQGISEGGVLQPLMRQLEVWCLPANIPESIVVDVTPLHVGQSLHLSDLKLPENVKAASHEDVAIVTVTVIKDDEPAAPVGTAAATAATATPAAGAATAEPAADAKKDAKK